MSLEYPQFNGNRFSWASVVVKFGAQQFLGCKSLNINEKVDPAKIHGTGQNIIGSTAGMYDADGDAEFYQQESDVIISTLGIGWMNKRVTIVFQYIDGDQPTVTIAIPARLTGRTQGGSESPEASTSKFTIFVTGTITTNGIAGIPPIVAARIGV